MNRKTNIFRGLLNLIHGGSGQGAKPLSPILNAPQNKVQSDKVNTEVDESKKLEQIAEQNQKDDQAQINAGMSAYSKEAYDEAIIYYKKALALNPSNGTLYNHIGNVYFRGKADPETAVQYYAEATIVEPSYNYGWLNLALCLKELGDIPSAKTTITDGLEALGDGDVLYQVLNELQSQLN